MNKKMLLVVYSIILLFASCEHPIEYREIEIEKQVDNVVLLREVEYIEKEVYVMTEQEAIKEYDNYVTLDSKVLGVTDNGFEEIPLIKGLFKKGIDLYFQIDDKFYSQSGGVITEIKASDYPEIPASEHIVFENSPYKIFQYIYNGIETSRVTKYISEDMQPVTAYMQIDGACMRGNDLLYSVSESVGIRYKGVYIWTTNGNPLLIFDNGRVW